MQEYLPEAQSIRAIAEADLCQGNS